jgi:hypothetical protein
MTRLLDLLLQKIQRTKRRLRLKQRQVTMTMRQSQQATMTTLLL